MALAGPARPRWRPANPPTVRLTGRAVTASAGTIAVDITSGGYGARPTIYNTGPAQSYTNTIAPGDVQTSTTYSRYRITGEFAPFKDDTVDADWEWTFIDCEFDSNVFLRWWGPSEWGVYGPNVPKITLTRCKIGGVLVAASPVEVIADECQFLGGLYVHSGNLNVYTDWRQQFFPLTITNCFFWSVYLSQPAHTETWFQAGYPDGIYMKNVVFSQETGSLTNSGVTGVTNIWFGDGTYTNPTYGGTNRILRGYFDWGLSPEDPTGEPNSGYYVLYCTGHLLMQDSYIAKRSATYYYDRGTEYPTFTNCRELDTDALLTWNGTGLE